MSALPDPAQLRHNLFCALPKMRIIEQGRKTGSQLTQIFARLVPTELGGRILRYQDEIVVSSPADPQLTHSRFARALRPRPRYRRVTAR